MAFVETQEEFAKVKQLFVSVYKLPFDTFDDMVKKVARQLGFGVSINTYNTVVSKEVVERYNRDIFRLMLGTLPNGPDPFKQAGYLTFWIRKLKPFEPASSVRKKWKDINELIALLSGKTKPLSVCPSVVAS